MSNTAKQEKPATEPKDEKLDGAKVTTPEDPTTPTAKQTDAGNEKQADPDGKSQSTRGVDGPVVDRTPTKVAVPDGKDAVFTDAYNAEIADALPSGKLGNAVKGILARIDSLPNGGRLDFQLNQIREELHAALVADK